MQKFSRLDRQTFDAVAAAKLPGFEYVLPRLSRAANHSVLWFGIAGGLALTRRHSFRRAALRGVLSISVASPAVNAIGKQIFRRKRPIIDLVPPIRMRWRLPTSPSFPSGHSASAAAFVTGVACESPRAAVPIGVLAAGVAASRVYTGAHYPGDVLAGLALGVTAGLATQMVWPARPSTARVARTAPAPYEALGEGQAGVTAEGPEGHGVVAVVNAGAGGDDNVAQLLRKELPGTEVIEAGPDDDLEKMLAEAGARARVLAAAGGDGTVNAAAKVALEHDIPLLVVPGGTFDHFARAFGLETPAEAVAAYRSGRVAHVDVAFVEEPGGGELVFLNTASFGVYSELVDHRDRMQKRLGFSKWVATALAGIQVLRHAEPVDVMIDGKRRRVWAAFIGNCAYGSRGIAPTWRKRLDDGVLDVRLVTVPRRLARTRGVLALVGGHFRVIPQYRSWRASTLRLSCADGPIRLATDGETETVQPEVVLTKRPRALSVFCP